jgi:hypothetical protein
MLFWNITAVRKFPISVYRLSLLDSIGTWYLSERIFRGYLQEWKFPPRRKAQRVQKAW